MDKIDISSYYSKSVPKPMTELLQQVILEIQKLPAEQQDAIALRLMAELKDEQRGTEQFESTTDEQWDRLADIVRQEIIGSDAVPLALNSLLLK